MYSWHASSFSCFPGFPAHTVILTSQSEQANCQTSFFFSCIILLFTMINIDSLSNFFIISARIFLICTASQIVHACELSSLIK
ncbi:Os01g0500600 [Oryza sativa Japonica Group]|uniref:Os01g0500600 protein n=2 Tax=Oryza sativa subsp. japonica TaxID=39947 RepID=Q0JMI4_ORYSJ|nr:hypothetical protein EE612_002884 [Oryza sativa]BAF05044.1 Os01g0500600 [Oryza sativa Japonica Group]BAS72315.1 Os01g0500600 [Oryza sativa Japonica Group]|eukprot:NP_001043130.1 Os01g0500600 [Oryza sativa Japonica Group]